MKKFMLMTLVLLVISGLTGCDDGKLPVLKPSPEPKLESELVLYNWEGDMPQSVLDDFSREYGVKVDYQTYESETECIENLRANRIFDVAVIESRSISFLAKDGMLAELNHANLPNFKNISANFRDLSYDSDNRYSIPYNWGTTGLVVRTDLVDQPPPTRWADLWDPRYSGRIALWFGQHREVIALTLKSLGYSGNSEKPEELEAALQRMNQLKTKALRLEDFDPMTSAVAMSSGKVVLSMGYSGDVLAGRKKNKEIKYVLPAEGALLWGDTFIIPAKSTRQYTAEVLINFFLRPDVSAKIANENNYATPNEAAFPLIDPAIRNDPAVFPSNQELKNAEIIMPLSPEGEKRYSDIIERFMAPDTQKGQ